MILGFGVEMADTALAVEELDSAGFIADSDLAGGVQLDAGAFVEANAVVVGMDADVVLTGDVHSSWANELAVDPFSADYDPETGRGARAVEFIVPGISSPGTLDPERAAEGERSAVERHPHVKWVNLRQRGYAVLDLDRSDAVAGGVVEAPAEPLLAGP